MRAAFVAAAVSLSVAAPSRAQPAPADTDTYATRSLRWDPVIDGGPTAVLIAGWVVTEAFVKHALAPKACNWCGGDGLDLAARRLFVPEGSPPSLTGDLTADTWSNVTTFGFMPAIALASTALLTMHSNARWEDALGDVLLVAEAAAVTAVLNQSVKFTVARARPFVSDLTPEQWPQTQKPDDNHLSFFSGHSSFAMSIAVAAGTVASMRGSKWSWAVWSAGVSMAVASGVLRMAADKHWLSDVSLGFAIGGAIGFLVPYLHGTKDDDVAVSVGPGGLLVSGRY